MFVGGFFLADLTLPGSWVEPLVQVGITGAVLYWFMMRAEDRLKFRDAMAEIGLQSALSRVVRSLDEARDFVSLVGLPAIIRPRSTCAAQAPAASQAAAVHLASPRCMTCPPPATWCSISTG